MLQEHIEGVREQRSAFRTPELRTAALTICAPRSVFPTRKETTNADLFARIAVEKDGALAVASVPYRHFRGRGVAVFGAGYGMLHRLQLA